MKRIAMIKDNDKEQGNTIYFEMNEETFEVTVSNDEEVTYGDLPEDVKQAFKIIGDQWGTWNTFEWLAEYDEVKNIAIEY